MNNIDKNVQKLRQVPYHKMGVKILDDAQLQNLFPDYEVIGNKIDIHREQIKAIKKYQKDNDLPLDKQGNLMYDNVFSIMGQRGAGKTSVALTLKHILPSAEEGDIALPMIMPEIIPQECSMIGWILSLLEEHVKNLDNSNAKKLRGNYTFDGCLYNEGNSLLKIYNKVKELCFSQFYQADRAESVSAAVINTQIQTQNSFDFAQELVVFWDRLVNTIKESVSRDVEPLVFIIFDDVDLMPDRAISLLSTIIKYLSHPNIIVLLTADESLLYDVIENDMSKKLGIYDVLKSYSYFTELNGWENDTRVKVNKLISQKIRVINEIPRLYGDKILPPACRYYLSTYDSSLKKANFIERIAFDEDNVHKVLLIEYVATKVADYLKVIGGETEENFVVKENNYVRAYLQFFGTTSRQLANEVLILEDFIDEMCKLYRSLNKVDLSENTKIYNYYDKMYSTVCKFVYSTISASGSQVVMPDEIKKDILDELIVYKSDIYINYPYVMNFMTNRIDKREELKPTDIAKQSIGLLMLMYFIENILVLESKYNTLAEQKRKKVHGTDVLVDVIDKVTTDEYSLICKGHCVDLREFLIFYENLFDSVQEVSHFNPLEVGSVKKYFQLLSHSCAEPSATKDALKKYQLRNPKWLRTMTQILFFSYESIYDITKDVCVTRNLMKYEFKIHDAYFLDSLDKHKENVIDTLSTQILSVENYKPLVARGYKGEEIKCESWYEIVNWEEILDTGATKKIKKISDMENICKVTVDERILTRIAFEDGGAEKLFGWLEEIYEKLISEYNEFTMLGVDGEKDTIDMLMRISQRESQDVLNIISEKIFDRDRFNEAWDRLITNIIKLEKNADTSYYYGETENLENNKIFANLCKQRIYIPIDNPDARIRARNIIIFNTVLESVQKYYIIAYLRKQKKVSRQINIDQIPYKRLYKAIMNEVNNKEKGYLSTILKGYIRDGCRRYVDMLWER